jgi:hypothetical protein
MSELDKELLFLIEEFEDGRVNAYQLVKLIKEKINDQRNIFS